MSTPSINTDSNGQVIFTPIVVQGTAILQTDTGQLLELDPSTVNLLNTTGTATVPLEEPGVISAKDFIGQTTTAVKESKEEDEAQKEANPLYYKLFGLGLVGVLERITFLQGNLDAFVEENNTLNTTETALFATMGSVGDVNSLISQMNTAVNNYNNATNQFNNGQITQAQYDAAVNAYNNSVSNLNSQMATALSDYNFDIANYNLQVPEINGHRQNINEYISNFTPPVPPYPLLTEYPPRSLGDVGLPSATPGSTVSYSPGFLDTVPTPVTTVNGDDIQSQQIDPLVDDNAAIKALLQASDNAIDFNAGLKQFGLRSSLTIKSTTQNIDTGGSGSSAAFAANSADTASQAKTLPSDLSKSAVQAQVLALGIPNGSPLVAATGYLVSTLYSRTGLYSALKALESLGLVLPAPGEPGIGPVTGGVNATGQVGPISARVSATVSGETEQPNPFTGVLPSATPAEIEDLSTTLAAIGNIQAVSDLINGGEISAAVQAIVDSDPNSANLTPEQRAELVNAITGAITMDLTLASLFSLSIALGAPSLMQQYLGNVAGLASLFPAIDNQSPADIVISNPASIIFFQQIISESLQESLGLSQEQADQVAEAVVTSAIQEGQVQSAQQLTQALQDSIKLALSNEGYEITQATAAANRASEELNDTLAFNAARANAIQEEQIKDDIATSLVKQNINEADASRAAALAVDQNRAEFRDQLLDTDAAAKRVSDIELLDQIVDSLSGAGIPRENAQIAAQFAFDQQKLIGLESIAIKRPVVDGLIARDKLAGELQTLIYNELVNLGLEKATAISSQITSTIILSPNSFINRNNAYVEDQRNVSLNKYDAFQLDQFREYLSPTLDLYVAAENFMDPGKLVSHNAATGIMYSQPVAIKNTPPILG